MLHLAKLAVARLASLRHAHKTPSEARVVLDGMAGAKLSPQARAFRFGERHDIGRGAGF